MQQAINILESYAHKSSLIYQNGYYFNYRYIKKCIANDDFYSISNSYNLTQEMIEQYIEKLSKPFIQDKLTSEQLEEYWYLGWDYWSIHNNPNIIDLVYDKWSELNLVEIFKSEYFTIEHIKHCLPYIDREYISALSKNPNLTDEIIEQYWHIWNKKKLSSNKCLSVNIIKRHIDELNLVKLSNVNLTEELIDSFWLDNTHYNKFKPHRVRINSSSNECRIGTYAYQPSNSKSHIYRLSNNKCITEKTIEKYWGEWDLRILSFHPNLTTRLLRKYFAKHIDEWDLDNILFNPNMTHDIIEDNFDVFDKNMLSRSPAIIPIIDKYWNRWDIKSLSLNKGLTSVLIEQHIDKLDVEYLSYNSNLPYEIIVKYKDRLVLSSIAHFRYASLMQERDKQYRINFNRVMNELSMCPYHKDYDPHNKYQHHYHQGYAYLMSLEDTMSLY